MISSMAKACPAETPAPGVVKPTLSFVPLAEITFRIPAPTSAPADCTMMYSSALQFNRRSSEISVIQI